MIHRDGMARKLDVELIKAIGIGKSYGNTQVLSEISVAVAQGERVAVCGPRGSGKSTLIRCIGLIENCTRGKIFINGVDTADLKASTKHQKLEIGFVFQDFNLFPHLTVMQNCTFALLKLKKMSTKDAESLAITFLERFQCIDHHSKYPIQLSDSQKQRVAIARSLCMTPRILLLDEPTSALDPFFVKEISDLLPRLSAEGTTIICVTHDLTFARDIADRMLFLEAGRVLEASHPSEFFMQPKHERLQLFLSRLSQERLKARQSILHATAQQFQTRINRMIGDATSAGAEMSDRVRALKAHMDDVDVNTKAMMVANQQTLADVRTVSEAAAALSAANLEIRGRTIEAAECATATNKAAEAARSAIETLATRMVTISDITLVIRKLAKQTDLLALNATIEATRTGEVGKGFGVVAAEMKHLATETAKAVERIADQIQTIQTATAEVVDKVRWISALAERSEKSATAIAVTVEQQSATTNKIALRVDTTVDTTASVSDLLAKVADLVSTATAATGDGLHRTDLLGHQLGRLTQQADDFVRELTNTDPG